MLKIGLIGGSGLENIASIKKIGEEKLTTPYGEPSSIYRVYEKDGITFYQLNRHGDNHCVAPHLVNYRANINGFKMLGVERIIAFTAVGSLHKKYPSGTIAACHNAIDFTHGRTSTFFEGVEVRHIDFSYPFCDNLRKSFFQAVNKSGYEIVDGGIYVCTNGPRLETAAEINFYRSINCDFVGMTLFPEAPLARESEICYLNISTVTNYAAGVETKHKLTSTEIVENGRLAAVKIAKIIGNLPSFIETERDCPCKEALKGSGF